MTEKEAQTEDAIEMVIIKNDTVIKKKFSVIDEDEVISFNLGNFFIAVRKEDLKKYL
jgi:chaperonin cofactor prefoldin